MLLTPASKINVGQPPPPALLRILRELASELWEADPGDLADRLDPDVLAAVPPDFKAIDGGTHVPVELLGRIAADMLPIAVWTGGQL